MLHYLLYTSIAWLCCLLLFEGLLRRETFHQYNRIFLLAALVFGLVLPVINWGFLQPLRPHVFADPVVQQTGRIAALAGLSAPPAQDGAGPHLTLPAAISITYITGVLIALGIVLVSAGKLTKLYRNGKRYTEAGMVVVETGVAQGPFSFFGWLFVPGRKHYADDEWQHLLRHEQEHSRRLHSVDNIFLLLLKCVFWFHPLPYLYHKRIRLVHEFQADEAAANDITRYGRFLLEQSFLQAAPLLGHSFYYSPVKNRITMLTQSKSNRKRLVKYAALLPLALGLILYCTPQSYSGNSLNRSNATLMFKGREIGFGPLKVIPGSYQQTIRQQKAMFLTPSLPDSILVQDWRGTYTKQAVVSDTMPVALNGNPIYGNEPQYLNSYIGNGYSKPGFGAYADLEEFLFNAVRKELELLDNGEYLFNINRIVLDDKGRIAYYEPKGFDIYTDPYREKPLVNQRLHRSIQQKLEEAMDNATGFQPAMKDGRPVNVRVSLNAYTLIVKNHKPQLVRREGC